MKVYLIKDKKTGERRRVYGKGTRVYTMRHNAVNACSTHQYVEEFELVSTGETWGKF